MNEISFNESLLMKAYHWPVDRVRNRLGSPYYRLVPFRRLDFSHARLADPIRPMPNNGKSSHSGLPIALISRLPDWVVQSVQPIAIY